MSFSSKQLEKKIPEPVSILMPVCNEAEGIESIIAELVEVVYRYLPDGSEFLVNEGGSTDGTKDILRELREHWPFLKITFKDTREGFAKAAHELYNAATCPLVFFTDSDGQCVASEFWKLASHIEQNDFVLGVKKTRYDPLIRCAASRNFNALARLLFRFGYRDINFGFRIARREALMESLRLTRYMPTLLNAEVTIIASCLGYRLTEVEVYHRPRLYGMSRGLMPHTLPRESWSALKALFKLYLAREKLRDAAKRTQP